MPFDTLMREWAKTAEKIVQERNAAQWIRSLPIDNGFYWHARRKQSPVYLVEIESGMFLYVASESDTWYWSIDGDLFYTQRLIPPAPPEL